MNKSFTPRRSEKVKFIISVIRFIDNYQGDLVNAKDAAAIKFKRSISTISTYYKKKKQFPNIFNDEELEEKREEVTDSRGGYL